VTDEPTDPQNPVVPEPTSEPTVAMPATPQAEVPAPAPAAAPVAAAPAPAAAPEVDLMDQLQKLGDLKAQGILTEEEFAAQKAKLLGS